MWSILIFILSGYYVSAYSGVDAIPVMRHMPSSVVAGETVTVEISMDIEAGIDGLLRGFYFTDQIPEDLSVVSGSALVTVNGLEIAGGLQETGAVGEVYAGASPYRIILETPPDFSEDNYLTAGDVLMLSYDLSIPGDAVPGTVYTFPGYSWAGRIAGQTLEDIFGYEDSSNTLEVSSDSTTTTTAKPAGCPVEGIYGEDSEEVYLLRNFRDAVLSGSVEGRELIRLYYAGSPAVLVLIENDAEFRRIVKTAVDHLLPLISGGSGVMERRALLF